jgi:hypothetical protein
LPSTTAARKVEVGDVEREDLARAGRGLVEHPPQGLLGQRMVGSEECEELALVDRAGSGVGVGRP